MCNKINHYIFKYKFIFKYIMIYFITHYTPLIDRKINIINQLEKHNITNFEFIYQSSD